MKGIPLGIALCWLGVGAGWSADLASGLAGYWRFENCDGKTVKDLSALGNRGAIEAGESRNW
jgi:hypothetical protein